MPSLRFRFSGFIKERIMRFYGVPFSRFQLEPALVPYLPRHRPITLVDVGASEGAFTDAVDRHCGVRRGLLVEPQPLNHQRLANRFDSSRFSVEACALSDAPGEAEMMILNFHYSSSLLSPREEFIASSGGKFAVKDRVTVPVATLDGILEKLAWTDRIDLLKLDVQGTELQTLRGAVISLAKTKMVWVEVSFRPMYEHSTLFSEIYDFMRAHSFQLCALQEGFKSATGELLQADALFSSVAVTSR